MSPALPALAALHDARTGVIRALVPHPIPEHFPPSFALTTARLADTTRFAAWAGDPAGAGYAFADPGAVLGAAVGEAVERYCGNLVPPGLVRGSYDELSRAGRSAVQPSALALFSPQQHAEPGFPAVPMADDLVLDWAEGADVLTGAPVLVPASLVWPS